MIRLSGRYRRVLKKIIERKLPLNRRYKASAIFFKREGSDMAYQDYKILRRLTRFWVYLDGYDGYIA